MRHFLIKHIALVLLLAQVWCVGTRASMVCIPLHSCDAHATAAGVDDPHPTSSTACKGTNHDHGLVGTLAHNHDDCGCHIHVPAPDDHQPLPGKPRSELPEMRVSFVPAPALFVQTEPVTPQIVSFGRHHSDRSSLAQARALKTTRLRI